MTFNPCFKAALEYVEIHKLAAIPCVLFYGKSQEKAEKKPLVNWKDYQQKLPTMDELAEWWIKWPNAQVGIVTGAISGIFVLDIDVGYDEKLVHSLGIKHDTPISKTPSGGWHVFYKYPKDFDIQTRADLMGNNSHLDCRGNGGFLVASPSVYPNGKPYKWFRSFDQEKPKDAPESLMKILGLDNNNNKIFERKNFRDLASGVSSGSRNQTATSIIGVLVRYLPEYYWGTTAWPLIVAWNEQNTPPLPSEELYITYESICNKERFAKAKWVQKNKTYPQRK